MAVYTRRASWRRWKGTLDDFVRAAAVAREAIERRWEVSSVASPTMVSQEGLVMRLDSPEDLKDNVDPRDIAAVELVDIRVKTANKHGVQLVARSDRDPAVTIQIEGSDRNEVDLLAQQLVTLVGRGRRRAEWFGGHDSIFDSFLLIPLLSLAALGVSSAGRSLSLPAMIAIVGAVVICAAMYCIAVWASPALELLGPGDQTRWERAMNRYGAILLTLVLGVVSSVIASSIMGL
jgi:hypothetical protein